MTVDTVVVPEHVLGLTPEWSCLPQLLDNPFHGGIVGRREVYHPPPSMMHYHEYIYEFEVSGGHGEEVHCPRHIDMVVKKRQPGCCSILWTPWPDHVFTDRVFAGRIEIQKYQRIVNSPCSPQWILCTQSTDKGLHLLRYLRAAGLGT